ncbi:hypothetical protein UFOVP711_35 [uncultured Caudovirales phage]|uniref:Uncharacterized protein n=1 Tax=uncultured Caudovirales phage TaxID=2100421 RepID=A0A6J5NNC8_9CAUD|nr:hypothetical protein UFOVP711_35 [uncultured Caudovirales phage]
MADSGVISLAVACISAFGAIGASVTGVLAAKARKEHRDFREENTSQHGTTLALIKDIELTTRETRQDVREIRLDVTELRNDFEAHQVLGASAHESRPRKEAISVTNPKAKAVKAGDPEVKRPRRRSA